MEDQISRRGLLKAAAGAAVAGSAGCISSGNSSNPENSPNKEIKEQAGIIENELQETLWYADEETMDGEEGFLDKESVNVSFDYEGGTGIGEAGKYSVTTEVNLTGNEADIQGYLEEGQFGQLQEDLEKPAFDIFWQNMVGLNDYDQAVREDDQDQLIEYNIRFNGEDKVAEHSMTSEEVHQIYDNREDGSTQALADAYLESFNGETEEFEGLQVN